jgi:hypothetical protein
MIDYFPEKPWHCKCGCKKNNIQPKFVRMLNVARFHANTAFYMNSVCRCVSHNETVGGKEDSAHLYGTAGDIKCKNSHKRYKILRGLLKAGFKRIGVNSKKGFIHADCDDSKPSEVIWGYDD